MRFAILLALMCVCTSYTLAAKEGMSECKYTNAKGGQITPFFMDKYNFDPFPCDLLLAKFTCGNISAIVKILNAASEEHQFRTRTVKYTVIAEYKIDGQTYKDTNILTADNKIKFLNPSKQEKKARKTEEGKKEASKKLWNWSSEPRRSRSENVITGTYKWEKQKGKPKKEQTVSLLVKAYDLTVEIKTKMAVSKKSIDDDEISISCPTASFTGGRPFPRALCGTPENSEEDVKNMLKKGKNEPDRASFDAAWDIAQLHRMDVVQTKSECIKAKKALTDRCDDNKFVSVVVDCHSYYSQQVGKNYYANCIRRQGKPKENFPDPINPFKVYQLCLKAQCSIDNIKHTTKSFNFTTNECGLLNKVSGKCGNLKNEGINIGTLVNTGKCTTDTEFS